MAETDQRRLARELDLYALHKDEWLKNRSQYYVVIKDDTVLDFFPTFEAAYRAGAEAWGSNTDFLVKRVVEQEPVFVKF